MLRTRLETAGIFILIAAVLFGIYWKLDERSKKIEQSNNTLLSFVMKQNEQVILLQVVNEKLKDEPTETRVKVAQTIYSVCTLRSVPIHLICGLIEVESGWDPRAKSGANALGLMQILPGTAFPYLRAEKLNAVPDSLFDPVVSVLVGISLIADLHEGHVYAGKSTKDDYVFSLHSYFWGSENTAKLYGKKDERVNVPNLSYPQRVLEASKKYKDLGL